MVAGFVGLFFVNGPGGAPILSFDNMTPTTPTLDNSQFNASPARSTHTEVYKWQDEEGVWQFSNQPQDMAGGIQDAARENFNPNVRSAITKGDK